jgi:formamidopyrimidine-DNA glycosylase
MPELPEVQTVVNQLKPLLEGTVFESASLGRNKVIRRGRGKIASSLPGRVVQEIRREGKWIIIRLRPTAELAIHLGMTGRLVMEPFDSLPAKHTHARFRLRGCGVELRFRDPRKFGGVWFYDEDEIEAARERRALGPDALSIRVPTLRQICRRRRQLKALLLDQRAISGLGNIYCDEAAFSADIHPGTVASDLTDRQIRALACSIRKTLRRAIASGGSTLRDYRRLDGAEGEFQHAHNVYGREGLACRRCGRLIVRVQLAGRSTHFCPRCQKRSETLKHGVNARP